jgi:hypothetical protein
MANMFESIPDLCLDIIANFACQTSFIWTHSDVARDIVALCCTSKGTRDAIAQRMVEIVDPVDDILTHAKLTILQLKQACRKYKLECSGRKSDLDKTLHAHLERSSTTGLTNRFITSQKIYQTKELYKILAPMGLAYAKFDFPVPISRRQFFWYVVNNYGLPDALRNENKKRIANPLDMVLLDTETLLYKLDIFAISYNKVNKWLIEIK